MTLTRLCKSNATKSDFDRAHPDVWPHGGKPFFLQGLHMGLISMPLRMCIMIFGKTNDYDEIHNVCTLYTFHNRTENDGKSVIRHEILCLLPVPHSNQATCNLFIIMSVSKNSLQS